MENPVFSIVAPNYNEVETVETFYQRVKSVMEALGEPWELVYVDDGSSDGSTDLIRSLARQDPCLRPVIFAA